MCICSNGIEITIHLFSIAQILILTDKPSLTIATIDVKILTKNEDSIVNTLLFGKPNSENSFNNAMRNMVTEFTISTGF